MRVCITLVYIVSESLGAILYRRPEMEQGRCYWAGLRLSVCLQKLSSKVIKEGKFTLYIKKCYLPMVDFEWVFEGILKKE